MSALVTVITPTIAPYDEKRLHTLLTRCIPSVKRQSYTPIEHLVVADCAESENPDFANVMSGAGVRLIYVGRRSGAESEEACVGAIARNVGLEAARGAYIAYLDDDDEFYENHVEQLVALLESEHSDVAISHMERDIGDTVRGEIQRGCIGTPQIAHRASIPSDIRWPLGGELEDFFFAEALLKAGLKFSNLARVTVKAYVQG